MVPSKGDGSGMRSDDYPILCVIGGWDPTGRAGLAADLATAAGFGVPAAGVLTAATVQDDQGLRDVGAIPPSAIVAQMRAAASVGEVLLWKIGMLVDAPHVRAIAEVLAEQEAVVVLDPVLSSSLGGSLLTDAGLDVLREELLPLVDLITPNLDEAARLLALDRIAEEEAGEAAALLVDRFGLGGAVLTGGRGAGDVALDWLVEDGAEDVIEIEGERIPNADPRGTGCTHATAVSCALLHGLSLPEAGLVAKQYVASVIAASVEAGMPDRLLHAMVDPDLPDEDDLEDTDLTDPGLSGTDPEE